MCDAAKVLKWLLVICHQSSPENEKIPQAPWVLRTLYNTMIFHGNEIVP